MDSVKGALCGAFRFWMEKEVSQMTILEAECLEHELAELNRLDQEITIAVANDFIDGNIIKLWRESPFFNETGNYWMGTLQLAQLISKDFP